MTYKCKHYCCVYTVYLSNRVERCWSAHTITRCLTLQYPKGLGATVTELNITGATCVVPKTDFSMMTSEVRELMPSLCKGAAQHVVLFGIEVHLPFVAFLRCESHLAGVVTRCTFGNLCLAGLSVFSTLPYQPSSPLKAIISKFGGFKAAGYLIAEDTKLIARKVNS